MPRIVNMRRNPVAPYIYCGRAMPELKASGIPAQQDSPLGNPFKLTGRGMKEVRSVLAAYRLHLFEMIRSNDPHVMLLMREITEDSVLACWCVDMCGEEIFVSEEKCHCQVIWKAWRWLQYKGNYDSRIPRIS